VDLYEPSNIANQHNYDLVIDLRKNRDKCIYDAASAYLNHDVVGIVSAYCGYLRKLYIKF
jgi:hypothetical protein